jgi:hypothetical protein
MDRDHAVVIVRCFIDEESVGSLLSLENRSAEVWFLLACGSFTGICHFSQFREDRRRKEVEERRDGESRCGDIYEEVRGIYIGRGA